MTTDAERQQIAIDTAKRSMESGDETKWFLGYYISRDEGSDHAEAMELADQFVKEELADDD